MITIGTSFQSLKQQGQVEQARPVEWTRIRRTMEQPSMHHEIRIATNNHGESGLKIQTKFINAHGKSNSIATVSHLRSIIKY